MNNFILFVSVFIFLASCKKEKQPELSPFNEGCDCAKEVSAEFIIEEFWGDINGWDLRTETDTAYTNKNIYFSAKQDSAEYKWYLGTEILTEQVIGRFFPNANVENQTISVSLVVKKKPNNICFPNDDGYDSITKYLHFVKLPDNTGAFQTYPLNMVGTYRVKMPHLADSQDIVISCSMDESNLNQILSVSNYDGIGTSVLVPSPFPSKGLKLWRKNYAEIQLGQGPYASIGNYFFGFLRRKVNTNQFEFDISLGSPHPSIPNYIKRTYVGRKIN